MFKEIYSNLKPYSFDSTRKGAKYSFDGVHWMNAGEFIESQYKAVLGLEAKKDANTAFDAASDIEELNRSVKSSKATLCNEILGKDLQTSLDCYFSRVASTSWAWAVVVDDTLTVYVMNAEEFRVFTESWASYSTERRIRYKVTSGKMLKWLEERI